MTEEKRTCAAEKQRGEAVGVHEAQSQKLIAHKAEKQTENDQNRKAVVFGEKQGDARNADAAHGGKTLEDRRFQMLLRFHRLDEIAGGNGAKHGKKNYQNILHRAPHREYFLLYSS